MKTIMLSLMFFCLMSISLFGQDHGTGEAKQKEPFKLGIVDKIQSAELQEVRVLNIYLPEGYSPDSSFSYPVIYLLDGSANEDFIHVVGVVQFLTMIESMPKSIVVGIANVDRRRDFTFPTNIEKDKKAYPTTGGSARFIAFLENELEPYIQKSFKTNNNKTIIGQSLGGLLATEILLKKPYLFHNYIIVSPSLWWDAESLLRSAPGLLQKQTPVNARVYVSVGTEGNQMEGDAKELLNLLRAAKTHVDFQPLPDENHLTILHNSVYKGLKIVFGKATKSSK
jgi:predicted alpha/beta superfamily hydrolase